MADKMPDPRWKELEYRLPAEGRSLWSQSYYFNAYDPASGIGCILRAGFMEASDKATSWIIFFKDGDPVYLHYNADLPCPSGRLGDGIDLAGLMMQSTEALRGARVSYRDNDFAFELDWSELHPLVDAVSLDGDDGHSFVGSLAQAHLEGTSKVTGHVTIDGDRHAFAGTGARDIAAGIRNWGAMEHYRVAWPIFEDGTSIVGVRAFVGGHSTYVSMANDGGDWYRITDNIEQHEFSADAITVDRCNWRFGLSNGRSVAMEGVPLFRTIIPAGNYILAEHIGKFVRDDGVVGWGLIECGHRLPFKRRS